MLQVLELMKEVKEEEEEEEEEEVEVAADIADVSSSVVGWPIIVSKMSSNVGTKSLVIDDPACRKFTHH